MSNQCDHGHLRRSCELCQRDEEIDRLKAERDALKTELHIAVGMLSTQPDYSATYPMDVLQIVKDAAIDAARSET